MEYSRKFIMKNGKEALLRSASASDGEAVWEVFNLTHGETDYLLSYPDENTFTPEQEAQFLERKEKSLNEVEIVALVDGKAVGNAGIEAVGTKDKVKHRAEFGISVLQEYWGLGLGRALAEACIQCAKDAGYAQLELNAVAENERAVSMYRKLGFEEFGRNPKGFRSRVSGYQELIYMLMDLES